MGSGILKIHATNRVQKFPPVLRQWKSPAFIYKGAHFFITSFQVGVKQHVLFQKRFVNLNFWTWQFFVTFLGWSVKWPLQRSSDLQLGDKKVTLNHLGVFFFAGSSYSLPCWLERNENDKLCKKKIVAKKGPYFNSLEHWNSLFRKGALKIIMIHHHMTSSWHDIMLSSNLPHYTLLDVFPIEFQT